MTELRTWLVRYWKLREGAGPFSSPELHVKAEAAVSAEQARRYFETGHPGVEVYSVEPERAP
jgi:hypothetical protein